MEKEQMIYFKTLFHKIQQEMLNQGNTDWSESENAQEEMLGEAAGGDQIELSKNSSDHQLQLKLQGRGRLYLKKVNEALDRLHQGTFGECEECQGLIGIERLKARPTATLCIHCKEEQERGEEHIPYHKRSHTLGKTLSIVTDRVVALVDEGSDTLEKINGARVLAFTRQHKSNS